MTCKYCDLKADKQITLFDENGEFTAYLCLWHYMSYMS